MFYGGALYGSGLLNFSINIGFYPECKINVFMYG